MMDDKYLDKLPCGWYSNLHMSSFNWVYLIHNGKLYDLFSRSITFNSSCPKDQFNYYIDIGYLTKPYINVFEIAKSPLYNDYCWLVEEFIKTVYDGLDV